MALLQLSILLLSQWHVAHAASFRGSTIDGPAAAAASVAVATEKDAAAEARYLQSNPCTGQKNKDCNAPTCEWIKGGCVLAASPITSSPTDAPTKGPIDPTTTTTTPATTTTTTSEDPPTTTTSSTTTTSEPATTTTSTTTTSTTNPVPLTCPEQHCANDIINTVSPIDASVNCPNLVATTIATFEYNGDVLIELTGPSSMSDAADLVITSPHGGDLKPAYIPDRATSGTYCPSSGCKTSKDSYTLQISELLQSKFIANYCKVPFLVKNHLHRSKLDANRDVLEAAQEEQIAVDAWYQFHNLTNFAQSQLQEHFGSLTVNGITGAKSLLFDMHGYAGLDWVPTDGSPLIQWGYRLSDDPSLNPDTYCPLDTRSSGTIGTMTHARWMPGQSYECLVRGPGSLGSRVSSIVTSRGGLGTTNQNSVCGSGTPSYEHESPWHLANDPAHCDEFLQEGTECHYYSGGYDVEVHERMDWENISGDHFNTVQAELPRCIRFGGEAVREEFADVLSVAVMSFLRDLYGELFE